MKSLINECLVLNCVIEKYKLQNKQNPCSLCEYATEHCKQYLKSGFVPLTGEEIIKPQELKENIKEKQLEEPVQEIEKEVEQEENQEIKLDSPTSSATTTTPSKRALKSTPKKKKRKKRH